MKEPSRFDPSVFPEEIEKEVIADHGFLEPHPVKERRTFDRLILLIGPDKFRLAYLDRSDAKPLFAPIEGNWLELQYRFDEIMEVIELPCVETI